MPDDDEKRSEPLTGRSGGQERSECQGHLRPFSKPGSADVEPENGLGRGGQVLRYAEAEPGGKLVCWV